MLFLDASVVFFPDVFEEILVLFDGERAVTGHTDCGHQRYTAGVFQALRGTQSLAVPLEHSCARVPRGACGSAESDSASVGGARGPAPLAHVGRSVCPRSRREWRACEALPPPTYSVAPCPGALRGRTG